MAYGKYKDFTKRTQSDEVLKDKAFEVASNLKYDGYQKELASVVYKFFMKKQKEVVLKMKLNKINHLPKNFIN